MRSGEEANVEEEKQKRRRKEKGGRDIPTSASNLIPFESTTKGGGKYRVGKKKLL